MRKNVYLTDVSGFLPVFLDGQATRYMISKDGKLISHFKDKGWKLFHPSLDNKGYHRAVIRIGNTKYSKNIHRLVAFAFIPLVDGKNDINHIDGNKTNNSVENLEWCTKKENIHHSYRLGLSDVYKRKNGAVPKAVGKFTDDILLKKYPSISMVRIDGYPRTSVARAIEKNWEYRGHKWKLL